MRISEIKSLTDNYKVRGALSMFWEMHEYRKALEKYNKDDCSIFDVYTVLVNVFLEKHDCDQKTNEYYRNERRCLKD